MPQTGKTPLHLTRNVAVSKVLLDAGADVDARDKVRGIRGRVEGRAHKEGVSPFLVYRLSGCLLAAC